MYYLKLCTFLSLISKIDRGVIRRIKDYMSRHKVSAFS